MSSESPDDEYARLESDAYQMLFDFIRSDVTENEKESRKAVWDDAVTFTVSNVIRSQGM